MEMPATPEVAKLNTSPATGPLASFFDAPEPDWAIVEKARSLVPFIRANAQASEDHRRVQESVVEALQSAGLYHISVPARLGGSGANFRTFIEAVAEVARGDGGTAWAMALLNVCTWFASLYSDKAQQEAFADPRTRICGIFTA